MEIANGLMNTGHACSFLDMKRYSKHLEIENTGITDFFGVDDLLDFTNEELGTPIPETTYTSGFPAASMAETNLTFNSKTPHITELGDICVPCEEDLAQLEWLSNFVEESFSSPSVFNPDLITSHAGERKTADGKPQFSSSPVSVLESLAGSEPESYTPVVLVRGRARSKRSRTGVCFWNTRILSTTDTSATILESPSTSTVTTTAPPSPEFYAFPPEQTTGIEEGCSPAAAKKAKQQVQAMASKKGLSEGGPECRRCLHCGIQKTPQWRAGPMGPKTLCNACGVRYKSGRLLPEYRPAASPTFVETIHSNSHRKVLELRRQKESHDPAEEELVEREDHDASQRP